MADDLRVIGTFHNLIDVLGCHEVLLVWTDHKHAPNDWQVSHSCILKTLNIY